MTAARATWVVRPASVAPEATFETVSEATSEATSEASRLRTAFACIDDEQFGYEGRRTSADLHQEDTMAQTHDVTDDIVYDLVSIQYHALQALESYRSYLDDAHREEHAAITQFIDECRNQDVERARKCHELLGDLTATA